MSFYSKKSRATSSRDKNDPSEVRRHNEDVVSECEKGDLIEFPRKKFGGSVSHWAVYVGRGRVIHFTGENKMSAKVQEDRFWDVVGDSKAQINNYLDDEKDVLPKNQIVQNAESKLGTKGYDPALFNCEHFATWCRYGVKWSQQVIDFMVTLATGGVVCTRKVFSRD